MELSDYRNQIDHIDKELIRLFAERMDVAAEIAAYKKEHGLAVLDPARERAKLLDVAEQTPEKNFVYNEGYCPIHETVKIEELKQAKAEHPEAEVLTHPECPKSLLDLSDYIGSTSGIIDRVGKSDAEEFIICT